MSTKKFWWVVLGLILTLSLGQLAGCGGDDDGGSSSDGDTDTDTDSDTDSNADTGTGTETVEEVVALNMDFENGLGGADKFYLSVPDQEAVVEDTDTTDDTDTTPTGPIYPDNNTATLIAGENALVIHADAGTEDYGYAVEFQLALDRQTDMSGYDHYVSFDIYIPQATMDLGANVQFALFETAEYTPVYSKWYSVGAEQWIHIYGQVTDQDGTIDYSGFENNPGDWIFDVLRIKVICNGDSAAEGSEILYYVDNIRVDNTAE